MCRPIATRTRKISRGLARLLEAMAEGGYILVLDEFQYFNRKGYEEFCSYLQAAVDRLAAKADPRWPGGLIVLGSIHSEMMALLEDRTAPLYNRVTDTIDLTHLDVIASHTGHSSATIPTHRLSGCCSSGTCLKACRSSTGIAMNRGFWPWTG